MEKLQDLPGYSPGDKEYVDGGWTELGRVKVVPEYNDSIEHSSS